MKAIGVVGACVTTAIVSAVVAYAVGERHGRQAGWQAMAAAMEATSTPKVETATSGGPSVTCEGAGVGFNCVLSGNAGGRFCYHLVIECMDKARLSTEVCHDRNESVLVPFADFRGYERHHCGIVRRYWMER